MNKELKAKWIAALRSGKYKQGRSRLKHSGRHCCLGVLCEVAGYQPARHEVDLTLNPIGDAIPIDAQNDLIELNDARRASFADIAVYIEENL
jgi:hypothetical protein